MLENIKIALRITSDSFDTEIQELIDAALIDLKISGVNNLDVDDALVKRAVTIYCKANFGLNNQDSEKYQHSYDMLRNHMSLSSDYNEVV